jgi:hypothetical protein
VTQGIDIWSLGCVFSVAATWAILGKFGVMAYREHRRQAIQSIIDDHPGRRFLDEGDHFHNSTAALPIVKDWHTYLRGLIRPIDPYVGPLLELIDSEMLKEDGNLRIGAEALCGALKRILEDPTKVPDVGSNDFLTETLRIFKTLKTEDSDGAVSNTPSPQPPGSDLPQIPSAKSAWRKETRSRPFIVDEILPRPSRDTEKPSYNINSSEKPVGFGTEPDADLDEKGGAREKEPNISAQDPVSPRPPRHRKLTLSGDVTIESLYKAYSLDKPSNKLNKLQLRFGFKRQPKRDDILSQHVVNRDFVSSMYGHVPLVDRANVVQKLLVDNGTTMSAHWADITKTVATLVAVLGAYDADGLDMSFFFGGETVSGSKDPVDFLKALRLGRPLQEAGFKTKLLPALGKLFFEYKAGLQTYLSDTDKHKRPKDVTIMVLTDGVWEGCDKYLVGTKIIGFVETLKDMLSNQMEERPFSIQFIQFGGNKLEGTDPFPYLDDELEQQCGQ